MSAEKKALGSSRASRAELIEMLEAYLAALVARDPARASLASDVRSTENGQKLEVGDGFWATCDGAGAYRHVVADPETQQVAVICVMRENGIPAIVGIRLKVADGLIVEAETIVSRDPLLFNSDGPQRLEALGRPLPIWTDCPPVSSRDEMLAATAGYLAALERNRGDKIAPLAPTADRWDNGMRATRAPELDPVGGRPFYALSAAEQLASGYFQFVTGVRETRLPLVDEEFGVVLALTFLDHAGTVHEVTLSDGTTAPIGVKQPFSWQIMDMFKIEGGRIQQMEVLLNKCFYGMKSGW